MAKCDICGLEMLEADGCGCTEVLVQKYKGDVRYPRIKVGDEKDLMYPNSYHDGRCADCNAKIGYFHHPECDAETCPICGEQLLSCDCMFSWILPVSTVTI